MRILHILPDLYTGGAQKFCIDTCNELSKDKKNEVTICSIEKLTKIQAIMHHKIDPNVKFISMNKSGKNPIFILKIAKVLFSIKPDIIHTHTSAQFFSALGLLLYKKPNVHTIHSVAHKETSKKRLDVYKFLYKNFDFTPVSISERVLKSTQDFYGERYRVKIDNGVRKLEKSPEFNKIKQFIDSLKKDKNTKIFVSIGRFYKVKNQELLIDSFEELLNDGIDAHLIVLGSLDVVPEYSSFCKNKIKTKDRIHLLGEKENITGYLLNSDALCLSSIYEGLPMSILEAMSVGIPTISTTVGGIPDVVIDGKSGYLSKDMSISSYKDALKKIVFDNGIVKEELISHFDENYTIENSTKRYMDLYKQKAQVIDYAKRSYEKNLQYTSIR